MSLLERIAMLSHKNMQQRKSGVALVIVLALLALLMIASASFLFTMRVERAGASNNRYDWMAGQVAHAGFDYALASIDHFFINSGSNGWSDGEHAYWEYDSGRRSFTLHAGTFVSLREELSKNQADRKVAHAEGFIPIGSRAAGFLPPALAYRGSALKLTDLDGRTVAEIDSPEWIPVRPFGSLDKDSVTLDSNGNVVGQDKEGGSSGLNSENETTESARNPVVGRYAFMAFDTSGLVDINCVMKTNSRSWGNDPAEIQLDYKTFAADFKDKSDSRLLSEDNVLNFMDIRDADGSYVSTKDMAALNEYFDPAYSRHLKAGRRSFDPLWPAWTNVDDVVEIGGDADELKRHFGDIIDAFIDSGLEEEQAKRAACALVDYVDSDYELYEPDSSDDMPDIRPVTEAMPLLAGGMVRFRIRKWKLPPDPEADRGEEPVQKYKYQVYAEGAIPFNWMFVDEPDVDFLIGGKILVRDVEMEVGSGRDDDCRGLIPSRLMEFDNDAEGVPRDYDDKRISFGYADREGISRGQNIIDFDFGKGDECEVEGDNFHLKMTVCFAGATYLDDRSQTRLHSYPSNEREYGETSDPDATQWLPVTISIDKDDFEANDRDSEDGPWDAEVVAWVDILDPRFVHGDSGSDMNPRDPSDPIYCCASHPGDGTMVAIKDLRLEDFPRKISNILNFKSDFEELDRPAVQTTTEGDRDRDAFPLVTEYFEHLLEVNSVGCSVLSQYLLAHPEDLRDRFNIQSADGVRFCDRNSSSDPGESLWRARVKNGKLDSVGELGFLQIGPWLTVRLYDYDDEESERSGGIEGFHTVLDHFAIDASTPHPGRVGIDSSERGVISAPFYQLPLYVNGDCRISGEDAEQLAKVIMRLRASGDLQRCSDFGNMFLEQEGLEYDLPGLGSSERETGSEISCRRLSDSACLPSKVIYHTLSETGSRDSEHYVGEFEREALIGKSYNLFTNRGRTFLIVVKAQSYTPGFFMSGVEDDSGTVHASRTLVAEVWRDTIDEDGDGNYPWKVISVTMLDE